MSTLEDENRELKEKNNELVEKVQHWRMLASQKEDEKLELMKEIHELRLKLNRLKKMDGNLEAGLQAASQEALLHLVQASNSVTKSIELAKAYMQERQNPDVSSPRWSSIGGTPSSEKVLKVPPMMMGGKFIQPVVSLNPIMALSRPTNNTPMYQRSSQNSSQGDSRTLPLPMHMLQEVYIPLTRIDVRDLSGSNLALVDNRNNLDDSTAALGLENNEEEAVEESQNLLNNESTGESRRLDIVTEDSEVELSEPPPSTSAENPLEGPSWLLDVLNDSSSKKSSLKNLEPDSTTQLESPIPGALNDNENPNESQRVFSPTVRRRKRPPTPPPTPRTPRDRLNEHSYGRVLKVLVPKMKLEKNSPGSGGDGGLGTPCKRPMRFDAPSPNGATDAGVIVSEATAARSERLGRDAGQTRDEPSIEAPQPRENGRESSWSSERDSDGSGQDLPQAGRSRRRRQPVIYKEKPLNRKMRRC